jgi:hypothetical protein
VKGDDNPHVEACNYSLHERPHGQALNVRHGGRPWGGEGIRRENYCDQKDLEVVLPDESPAALSVGCCELPGHQKERHGYTAGAQGSDQE